MAEMISKSVVMVRLDEVKANCVRNHKKAAVEAVQFAQDIIAAIKPEKSVSELLERGEVISRAAIEHGDYWAGTEAGVIKELEPIIPGSVIGKERLRCGKCKTRIEKGDLFCRHCSSKLIWKGDE